MDDQSDEEFLKEANRRVGTAFLWFLRGFAILEVLLIIYAEYLRRK
jgi:hypothetical protein